MAQPKPPPDPFYTLRGTGAAINVLKFAPKASTNLGLLMSGCVKGLINLWSLKTKRTELVLDGHLGHAILSADFLPDGKVISHGRDGHLKIWQCCEGRSDVVDSVPAPFLGFCQFSCLRRGKIQVHLDCFAIIQTITGMCMCLSFFTNQTTDKPVLITGYENGQLLLWDVMEQKVMSKKTVHNETVLCIDVDKENLRFVSGSADNKLYVSSSTSNSTLEIDKEVELKNPGTASVNIRRDRKVLATGGWDGRIRIYNWKKLTPLAYLSYHTDTVNAVNFSDDLPGYGQILAAGGKDTRISLWSLYNEKTNTEK
ncbi:Guanine nucleotide-binding protein subunit beta-like protein 1 [Acropora cervicornis]|uniref:Guanine nucleotide-binding protein subunit beta-like protein 1 n=1 Tax=Acropora cervicornis TaxID=6130 RepID=A0AAD9R6Y1_ACRCE|nr:Guanine nucleotide-binding protein subunit beta-like protein 1 [Acropora cervicornis]